MSFHPDGYEAENQDLVFDLFVLPALDATLRSTGPERFIQLMVAFNFVAEHLAECNEHLAALSQRLADHMNTDPEYARRMLAVLGGLGANDLAKRTVN